MITQIQLGDIVADVLKKEIKNVHLCVYPPTGKIRISAPIRMNLNAIRVFAISKLDWIKKQQLKMREQERETPRDYIDRESHYVWGQRYLLKLIEVDGPPQVELEHSKILLHVRPGTGEKKRQDIVEEWYRAQMKQSVPLLISKWERILGVTIKGFFVQRMKTRWGSCTPAKRTIRLNTDLVRKPRECLEYIVVHEMVHILERSHNERFVGFMDRFMPKWRFYRDQLNRLPLKQESWIY